MLIAGFAIKKAEDADWKWANAGIVIGGGIFGILVAALIGFFVHDDDFLPMMASPLGLSLALLGAFGAIAGNKWRAAGIRKGHKVEYAKDENTLM